MGKRTKAFFVVILLCILVVSSIKLLPSFLFIRPSPPTPSGEHTAVRVAFSIGSGINPWSTDLIDDLSQACAAEGMELIYHEPKGSSAQWQLDDVYALMKEDIQYLILFPCDNSILPEINDLAKANQVPVILISSSVADLDAYAATIYINAYAEGQLCAQSLIDLYGQNKDANIVEIYGPTESPIAAARDKGFRDAIAAYPNLRIIKTCYGGFNQLKAKDAMGELISANPKGTFNAVFACSDEDGLGALQALKIAGYDPGVGVSIVSANGIQDTKKAIIAGEYTATVESARRLGNVAIAIIARLEDGETVSKLFAMPYRLCTAQNVDTYEPTLY